MTGPTVCALCLGRRAWSTQRPGRPTAAAGVKHPQPRLGPQELGQWCLWETRGAPTGILHPALSGSQGRLTQAVPPVWDPVPYRLQPVSYLPVPMPWVLPCLPVALAKPRANGSAHRQGNLGLGKCPASHLQIEPTGQGAGYNPETAKHGCYTLA